MFNQRLKISLILFTALITLFLVYSWVSSHGYLEISAQGAESGNNITYTITDGKTGKITEIKTDSTSIKRLVKKSDYSVSVSQNDKSFIVLLKSSGFLKSTSKSSALAQEKSRTFIGNEPNTCMIYTNLLYSYDCGDAYSTLKLHLPATARDPSYVKNAPDLSTLIRGDMTIDNKPYLITQAQDIIGDGGLPTTIQPVRTNLSFSADKALRGLDPDKSYGFLNYRQGFIAYDDTFESILYFSGLNASPLPIKLLSPSTDKVQPVSFSVAGSQVGAFYSEQFLDSEDADTELQKDTKLQKGSSEMVFYDGSKPKYYKFDIMYSSGVVCGNNKICVRAQDKMDIFDVSGQKANHLFTVSDVKDVKYLNQKMMVVNSKQIIAFDNSLSGYAIYSFGGYTYCGMSEAKGALLVCIADKDNNKNALLVSNNSPNSDSIDKKILQLKESNAVKSVTAYKNFIHILQEAGALDYQSEIDGYGYSPDLIRAANEKINSKINQLAIDRSKYKIVLTY